MVLSVNLHFIYRLVSMARLMSRVGVLGLFCICLLLSSLLPVAQSNAQSYDVTAKVAPPPPTSPAIITAPSNFEHFTTPIITVEGTCSADTGYVVISRNGATLGMPLCENGVFSVEIKLEPDANILQAAAFNGGGEGPLAPPITVYYDPPLIPSSVLSFFGIDSAQAGQPMELPTILNQPYSQSASPRLPTIDSAKKPLPLPDYVLFSIGTAVVVATAGVALFQTRWIRSVLKGIWHSGRGSK
jgi:hypothetical protein